jgi:hypothetical protein
MRPIRPTAGRPRHLPARKGSRRQTPRTPPLRLLRRCWHPTTRTSLRNAAQRVLSAWDDEVDQRTDLPGAVATMRRFLAEPTPAERTAGPQKPREGTKQQQVLDMLRRPEGATVAQIAEVTGWQAHTVRGFFAGVKKRQGIAVVVAERVRQVGPAKDGARGSYAICRIAEAG